MTLTEVWLFLQQGVLSGLVTGSVYALLAVAFVTVFKTTDVPNFAQGEIFMVGGYAALGMVLVQQWPSWAVIPLTLLFVAAITAVFQRVVMEKVIRSKGAGVQLVIATLGLAYVLKGAVRQTGLGDSPRSLPPLVSTDTVMIGDAFLTKLDLMIFAVAVGTMAALFLMFNFTRVGKAMRAVGMNPRAAQIVGVSLLRIRMAVWALAGLISAVTALLIAPKILITPDIGHIAILAFAAAIVGGISSIPGAVVGGFIIGVAENLVGLFISTNAIVVAPFLAIMIVLIVRPQGILGGKLQVKKV
ncbi:branched-chain amino acid ABC transporter permease [Parapusillimonas granuli]|uniref:Branched-chain amino acid ABC transporter permease n=1 Tax=Parapusillimonas granuli TaxID=380911 RepID=A0A853G328_9BURK|nr:branched-chain amino acid ABC transporter permease [Parapusillimonas granuli]MBB5216689.1 branched-chain amino acid transport system permease protein [Parapusillimonas granuli]MEB2400018.1 branched-chain amino acid ABC transporter permease [Alcaligenaceae bacterium]NYT51748.1 branched-chain amino acid ABC transporter permease [Parapusillimonas granuli]